MKFGDLNIVQNGKVHSNYNEEEALEYMKNDNLNILLTFQADKKFYHLYYGYDKKIC